jgi:hypothetical protein
MESDFDYFSFEISHFSRILPATNLLHKKQ